MLRYGGYTFFGIGDGKILYCFPQSPEYLFRVTFISSFRGVFFNNIVRYDRNNGKYTSLKILQQYIQRYEIR